MDTNFDNIIMMDVVRLETEVPQLVIPKYKLLYEDPEVKLKAYEEEGENPEEEKEPEE